MAEQLGTNAVDGAVVPNTLKVGVAPDADPPTITGDRNDNGATGALAVLLSALEDMGLIIDDTDAGT